MWWGRYAATGIRDILKAAGVTQPTLYHHFADKASLLQTLIELHYGESQSKLEQVIDEYPECEPRLRAMVLRSFEFCCIDPRVPRLMFVASTSSIPKPSTNEDWKEVARVDFYQNNTTKEGGDYKSNATLDESMHFGLFLNSGSETKIATALFDQVIVRGKRVSPNAK